MNENLDLVTCLEWSSKQQSLLSVQRSSSVQQEVLAVEQARQVKLNMSHSMFLFLILPTVEEDCVANVWLQQQRTIPTSSSYWKSQNFGAQR